mmetsp:Transcript_7741/g.13285  ORF Transcript_7741/g.13285 Transcript_7741/m.13285 type:complete len:388 (-) Transcript_7741:862-2025(-)
MGSGLRFEGAGGRRLDVAALLLHQFAQLVHINRAPDEHRHAHGEGPSAEAEDRPFGSDDGATTRLLGQERQRGGLTKEVGEVLVLGAGHHEDAAVVEDAVEVLDERVLVPELVHGHAGGVAGFGHLLDKVVHGLAHHLAEGRVGDGVDLAVLGDAQLLGVEDVVAAERVEGEGVHPEPHGVHQHRRAAVVAVPRRNLLVAGALQDVGGVAALLAGGRLAVVDAEDRAHAEGGAVADDEGIVCDHVVADARDVGDGQRLLLTAAHEHAHQPGRRQRAEHLRLRKVDQVLEGAGTVVANVSSDALGRRADLTDEQRQLVRAVRELSLQRDGVTLDGHQGRLHELQTVLHVRLFSLVVALHLRQSRNRALQHLASRLDRHNHRRPIQRRV